VETDDLVRERLTARAVEKFLDDEEPPKLR
jgi:hypothetical protein